MNDEESTENNGAKEDLTKFYFFLIGITLLIVIFTYAVIFFVIIGIIVAIGFFVLKGSFYVAE